MYISRSLAAVIVVPLLAGVILACSSNRPARGDEPDVAPPESGGGQSGGQLRDDLVPALRALLVLQRHVFLNRDRTPRRYEAAIAGALADWLERPTYVRGQALLGRMNSRRVSGLSMTNAWDELEAFWVCEDAEGVSIIWLNDKALVQVSIAERDVSRVKKFVEAARRLAPKNIIEGIEGRTGIGPVYVVQITDEQGEKFRLANDLPKPEEWKPLLEQASQIRTLVRESALAQWTK